MSDILKLTARLLLDDKGFKTALDKAPSEAKKAGDGIAREGGRGLKQLEDNLKRVGTSFQNVGKTLSLSITAPLAAVATAAIASGRALGNYADALLDTSARTGLTTDRLQEFENVARAAGVSATALGDAAETLTRRMTSADEESERLARATNALGVELRVSETAAADAAARVDELARAAIEAGADASTLERAISEAGGITSDFAQIAIRAGADATRLGIAFDSLGIESVGAGENMQVLSTTALVAAGDFRTLDDVMPELLVSLANVEDRQLRNVLANEVFGRSASELIPVLELGADEIQRLTEEARAMGQVLSLDTLNSANEFRIAQAQLTAELGIASREITVALLPILLELTNFFRSTVVPQVKAFVTGITELIDRFKALSPEQQRFILGAAAIAAAIGPVVTAIGGLISFGARLVATLTQIRTGILALRTVVLAMSGPVGWITLAAVAVGTLLVGAIVRATDEDAKLARSLGVTREQAIAYREALEGTSRRVAALETESRKTATAMDAAGRAFENSTDNVDDLRAAVATTASQLEGPARQAFIDYAEQAIASGEDLQVVGARIADRARRNSLLSQVDTLAKGLEGDGRVAFVNYALEAIATADTSEEAFGRIMRGWARTTNAAQIAAVEQAIIAKEIQIAALQTEIGLIPAERRGQRAPLRDEIDVLQREITALRGTIGDLSGANVTYARTVQTVVRPQTQALSNDVAGVGAAAGGTATKVDAATELIEGSIAAARAEVARLRQELENAATDETRFVIDLDLQRAESDLERLLAAIAEARRLGASIPIPTPAVGVDVGRARGIPAPGASVSVSAPIGVTPGVTLTVADLRALEDRVVRLREAQFALGETTRSQVLAALEEQVAVLAMLRERTVEGSEANLRYTEALVVATRERDRAAAAIEAEVRATNDANGVRAAELTQLAQLLTWSGEVAQSKRDAALAEQQLAEATAAAMQLNLGYGEGLVGTAADAVAAAEAFVTLSMALASVGEATDQQVVTSLRSLEEALLQQRETLSPYSAEFAALTERLANVRGQLDEYALAAEAASIAEAGAARKTATANREAAASVADLTQRKMDLNEATETDAIAAFAAYEQALRAEIALVDENTVEYVELREELERILAIKQALEDGPQKGPVATGAEALRKNVENFGKSLGLTADTAEKFAGRLMNDLPLLGAAANGWQDLLLGLLTSTEGFGDLMEAINGILNPIIDVLEMLFPPLIDLVNALAPIVQVAAALVNVALQPLLFVIQKVFTPAITFVANLITSIWNAIANTLNKVLGVFGVRIPTVGGKPEETPGGPRVLGESGGIQVRMDANGNPSLFIGGDAAPSGSIARQRSVVAALRQALDNATTEEERSRIRNLLTQNETVLNQMTGEGAPAGGGSPEPEAPRGRINQLEARRRELQGLIASSDSEEEIARYNAELRSVDAELARLRGLGAPVADPGDETAPPESSDPTGLLPSLRAERAALAKQLDLARSPEEIARINDQIRDVDARINELQNLTLRPPEEREEETRGLISRLEADRRALQQQLLLAETPEEIARLNDGIRSIDAQLADLRALTNDLPAEIGDEVGNEIGDSIERVSPDFSFGGTAQSVQLAVATPLLDASIRMLEASQNMQRIFGAVGVEGAIGFSALPAFNSAIERVTPVLERLLSEGVSINVGAAPASGGSTTAYLRGV